MSKKKTPAKKNTEEHRQQEKNQTRQQGALGQLTDVAVKSVGDKLYYLGSVIIRYGKNSWRVAKQAAGKAWTSVSAFFKKLGAWFGRGFKAMWADITQPFRKFATSVKSYFVVLKSTKGRGGKDRRARMRRFFKEGWHKNRHLLGRMLNYLAPLTALVVCAAVVVSILNLNYALRVNYNGETIGFIENESVYDSARKIIENRIVSGSDGPIWSNETELSIAVIEPQQMVSQDIMAESLLKASESEIKDATGIYIGGVLYGATEDGAALIAAMEALKAPYLPIAQELGEDAEVRFSRSVEYVSGIFPAASVVPLETLLAEVTSERLRDIYVTANVGDNINLIAQKNSISIERIRELNPAVSDFTFSENGAELLVAQNEPLIRVKVVRVLSYAESIGFGTKWTSSSEYDNRTAFVLQSGEPGEKLIVKEVEYDAAGRVLYETVISEEIVKEPVDQEILVGTRDAGPYYDGSGGMLNWPCGAGYIVMRGWNATGPSPHYGIDIAAPYGTPIYAAESGTVTTALYTSEGYGNYVILSHAGNLSTLYGHCSTLLVQPGQYVERGALIALMGSTGNSTGNHVHFEVRIEGIRVPPEPYIGFSWS